MRYRDIIEYLKDNNLPQVTNRSLASYAYRNWRHTTLKLEDADLEDIESLTQYVEDNNIGQVEKITLSSRTGLNAKGEEVTTTTQTVAIKRDNSVSVEPTLQRATVPAIKINSKAPRRRSKPSKMNLLVVLPDMQIGGMEEDTESIRPTHDEEAINVALQILVQADKQHTVDTVVLLGDNLDFPEFSSHRSAPKYRTPRVTQYSIDKYSTILAAIRKAAPKSDIWDLPSNHVARMVNTMADKMPSLLGLSKAGETDPYISIANLCRFEEHGVKQVPGGYPDGKLWLSPNLRLEHGSRTSSVPGATSRKYLQEGVSVIYGHHHHAELLYHTVHTHKGSVTSFAGSPGALCSKKGVVPSALTGIDERGELAGVQDEKWQQGIWLVWYDPEGEEEAQLEPVTINNGKAIFRGQEYVSTVDQYGETLV